jgi:DNA replication and repair protein RecF
LITYGNKIINRRNEFIEQINEIIFDIHKKISGGKENIRVSYDKSGGEVPLEDAVKRNRERDLRTKSTTIGPHRDDMCFMLGDMDIRKFGSQGQQRTAALSLKLSEIELVKGIIKDTPILLLDDVLSELDQKRQEYLLESIHDIQALITCTGLDDFVNHRLDTDKIFRVQNGRVVEEN